MPYDHQFNDQSTSNPDYPITSYIWNFDDTTTSTEQNPCHTFLNPGTHNVSLTVTNECGHDTSHQSIPIGGDNMGEYIIPTVVKDGNEEIVNVPIVEPIVPRKFLDGGLFTPIVGNTVELLTEDGNTVLQTEVTDSEGRVVFTNVLHGNYNLRIIGDNINI